MLFRSGPINPQLKDPRTYTWTIDTLVFSFSPEGFKQTIMKAIWGLNDSLVYAVGYDANYGIGVMWNHYEVIAK